MTAKMPSVLLVSKPVAPPWTDSNKNLVRDIARGCTRWTPRVMVPRGAPLAGVISEPVYAAAGKYTPSRFANAGVLARLVAGPKVELWHFFFAPNRLTLRAGAIARTLRRMPTVHTLASAPDDLEEVTPWLFADRLVVLSEHTAKRLRSVGRDAVVIRPALSKFEVDDQDIARAREKYRLPERYVLYPGDLEHSDGARNFVRAAAGCKRDLAWVVAARPKTPRAREAQAVLEREALSLGAKITWLGEIDDIHAVTAGAMAVTLVVDTLHAKMDLPLVLLEAMAKQVPVVVARGSAAAELVSSGGAIEVECSKPEALRESVEMLCSDSEKAKALGALGARWVTDNCAPSVVAEAYESVWDGLVRAKRI